MSDTYTKEFCPKCGKANWFCHGDLSDCTSSMGEEPIAQCWSCSVRWWLPSYDNDEFERRNVFEMNGGTDNYQNADEWMNSKDAIIQTGKEKP
jgi:hypothetical protein